MTSSKIAKNTTYFTGSLVIQKAISFVYFWYISNNLAAEHLGQFVFALSFSALFSLFVHFGLPPVLVRESAKNPEQTNLLLKNILGLTIPLAIFAFALTYLSITFTGRPPEVKNLVYLSSFIVLLDALGVIFYGVFRSRQVLKYESIGNVIFQIINFSIAIIALRKTGDLRVLMLALIIATTFNTAFATILVKVKLKYSLLPELNRQVIKKILKLVPAFAIAAIFTKIYNTFDTILLGYLAGDKAVGLYAVPAKTIFALQNIIPAAFAGAIFPAFSHLYVTDKTKLSRTFTQSLFYVLVIGIPLSLGLIALLPQVLNTLWPAYTETLPTFYVMAAALPFVFFGFPTGYLLNATDKQRQTTTNRGFALLAALAINLILIPQVAQLGAAIAFLASNIIIVVLDLWRVNRVTKLQYKELVNIVVRTLIAGSIMFASLVLLGSSVHLIGLVLVGAAIYLASLHLLGVLKVGEIIRIFKQVTKK